MEKLPVEVQDCSAHPAEIMAQIRTCVLQTFTVKAESDRIVVSVERLFVVPR